MADYKIDKAFLQRSKELKIDIDEEWYNGELKVYTVASIDDGAGGITAEFGTVEELFGVLKGIAAGNEVEVLINPDNSARAENGIWKLKWQRQGSRKADVGTDLFARMSEQGNLSFSVIGDIDTEGKLFVFATVDESDSPKYYVIDGNGVKKNIHPDGSVITTDIDIVGASYLLTQTGEVICDWKFVTEVNNPKNIKRVKIEFSNYTVFNGVEFYRSSAEDLPEDFDGVISKGKAIDIEADGWNLMAVYPEDIDNRVWKTEWAFEYDYFKNMKTPAVSQSGRGSTLSNTISYEINSQTDAKNAFNVFLNDANNERNPRKLYGSASNGYSIVDLQRDKLGENWARYDTSNLSGGSGTVAYMWSNIFTKGSSEWVYDFFIEALASQYTQGKVNAPAVSRLSIEDGDLYYMASAIYHRDTVGTTDVSWVQMGGLIPNAWYGTKDFYKKFIGSRDFEYQDASWTPFVDYESISKPALLKNYGSSDMKYLCLIPTGFNFEYGAMSLGFSQFFSGSGFSRSITRYIVNSAIYDNSFYRSNRFSNATPNFEETIENVRNQHSTMSKTAAANDKYIMIEFDEEIEEFNRIDLKVYGTGNVKYTFYNEAGEETSSFNQRLTSNSLAGGLTTTRAWVGV